MIRTLTLRIVMLDDYLFNVIYLLLKFGGIMFCLLFLILCVDVFKVMFELFKSEFLTCSSFFN